jgi:hypothetical protein
MTSSQTEAERLLAHIIANQPNLFKPQELTSLQAGHLALFCATFVHKYSGYLEDIKNNKFPPR